MSLPQGTHTNTVTRIETVFFVVILILIKIIYRIMLRQYEPFRYSHTFSPNSNITMVTQLCGFPVFFPSGRAGRSENVEEPIT